MLKMRLNAMGATVFLILSGCGSEYEAALPADKLDEGAASKMNEPMNLPNPLTIGSEEAIPQPMAPASFDSNATADSEDKPLVTGGELDDIQSSLGYHCYINGILGEQLVSIELEIDESSHSIVKDFFGYRARFYYSSFISSCMPDYVFSMSLMKVNFKNGNGDESLVFQAKSDFEKRLNLSDGYLNFGCRALPDEVAEIIAND